MSMTEAENYTYRKPEGMWGKVFSDHLFTPIRDTQPEFRLQSIGLKNGIVFYNTLYGPRRPSMKKRGLPFWIAPPLCITRD